MVDVVRTVIRLGNFSDGIADIDPDGTGSAEGAGNFVNEIFTPAMMSIETITYSDGDNNGFIDFDDFVGAGGDYVTYDLGAGPTSETVDQSVWFDVDIQLEGGGTLSTSALIFQTPSGETFLTEFASSLDNLDIQSITVTGVNNSFFARMATNNSIENTVVCFGPGTEILTPEGPRDVKSFQPGDMVITLGGEAQPVTSIFRLISHTSEVGAPLCFEPDALGVGMPKRRLMLSGNHRVLCASRLVERMFGARQVLIPAKRFVNCALVSEDRSLERVEYHHLELPEHAIVFANGAPVESCLLGPVALSGIPNIPAAAARAQELPAPCRPVPPGHRQRQFLRRLRKNRLPVVDEAFLEEGGPPVNGENSEKRRYLPELIAKNSGGLGPDPGLGVPTPL